MKTEQLGRIVPRSSTVVELRKRILARVISMGWCALLGLALMVVFAGRASATSCASSDYCADLGGSTAATQLLIGTVGTGDFTQIGNVSVYNNSGTAPCCAVSNSQTSMWYEFYWNGGSLEIQGGAGNNGSDPTYGLDMELLSDGSSASNSSPTLVTSGTPDPASINIPSSNILTAGGSLVTLYSGSLTAGYYSLHAYLPTSESVDPTFQYNFSNFDSDSTGSTGTPEPSSIEMLGVGLLGLFGLAAFTRRRSVGIEAA